MIASWRVALRLARREALRHKLRSALTAALVGAPVMALVVVAVLVASAQISGTEYQHRYYGAAQFTVNSGTKPVTLSTELDRFLPHGSEIAVNGSGNVIVERVGGQGIRAAADLQDVDTTTSVTNGILHLRSGSFASAPGTLTVSPALAAKLTLHIGDRVSLSKNTFGSPSSHPISLIARIVGIAAVPDFRRGFDVSGSPATVGVFDDAPTLLVRTPSGTDLASVESAVAHAGYETYTATAQGRSFRSIDDPTTSSVSDGALVVGLALLIAALTSGSAFAVGARRQRRTLGLIAVNGAHQPQLSRVVLANGLFLGAVGTIAAVPLGIALSFVGYPILQRHVGVDLPGISINALWILGAVLFGLVSALLAAAIPARLAARTPVAETLGQPRGATRTPRWVTALGLVLAAIGVLVALLGATSSQLVGRDRTPWILLGSGVVQLGGVAVCPVLVGAAGRVGRFLPATSRIALRDAARQRARSGPAVAAVAAAVSGAMALSVYAGSINLRDRQNYWPPVPSNAVVVSADGNSANALDTADRKVALAGLPVAVEASLVTVGTIGNGQAVIDFDVKGRYGSMVSDDGQLLHALTGSVNSSAVAALARGEAVVPDPRLTDHGRVPLDIAQPDGTDLKTSLATVVVPWPEGIYQPSAIISTATAAHLGLASQQRLLYARLSQPVARSTLSALADTDGAAGFYLGYDYGYSRTWSAALKALLVVSALFSLLVTASAAALAGADSRADLAALGAVGASPGVRRRLAAAQAGTTAVLGSGLGILIGLVPAYAVVIARSDVLPFTVPWQPFPVFLVGLPVLAALGGLAFTRSRLPKPARVR